MKNYNKINFILGVFLMTAVNSTVDGSWYNRKLEGWYYFEDAKEENEQEEKDLTPDSAEEIIEMKKGELKKLLSLAILAPTDKNVENYIKEQKKWVNQSSEFAVTWGKVLLNNPLLGDHLENPTSNFGILLNREYEQKKRKNLLDHLSKDWFLIYFFNGKEFASEKMAEVVDLFGKINNWKVKGVSLDGLGIKGLDSYEIDKGISQHFGISATPCLFIVNPTQNKAIPVGSGLISVSEIEQNIENQVGEVEYEETP